MDSDDLLRSNGERLLPARCPQGYLPLVQVGYGLPEWVKSYGSVGRLVLNLDEHNPTSDQIFAYVQFTSGARRALELTRSGPPEVRVNGFSRRTLQDRYRRPVPVEFSPMFSAILRIRTGVADEKGDHVHFTFDDNRPVVICSGAQLHRRWALRTHTRRNSR